MESKIINKYNNMTKSSMAIGKDTLLLVGDSKTSFRCECGCNVFKRISTYKYRCNGCRLTYTAEK